MPRPHANCARVLNSRCFDRNVRFNVRLSCCDAPPPPATHSSRETTPHRHFAVSSEEDVLLNFDLVAFFPSIFPCLGVPTILLSVPPHPPLPTDVVPPSEEMLIPRSLRRVRGCTLPVGIDVKVSIKSKW